MTEFWAWVAVIVLSLVVVAILGFLAAANPDVAFALVFTAALFAIVWFGVWGIAYLTGATSSGPFS